jgi:hypothetical protein
MLIHHPGPDGGLIELPGEFTLQTGSIGTVWVNEAPNLKHPSEPTGKFCLAIQTTYGQYRTNETRDRAEVVADLRTVTGAMKSRLREKPADGLTYGPWTTLQELRPGAIFETESGWRGVRPLQAPTGGCLLLERGTFETFSGGEQTRVREIFLPEVIRE